MTGSDEKKDSKHFIIISLTIVIFCLCCIGSVSAYTITFIVDGDGADPAPDKITVESGEYITLPTATWSGHTFSCWKAGGLKYYAGDRYKVTSSIKLYANWVPKYTVSFDGNGDGATAPDSITVDNGEYITLPTATWSGHTFSCWKAGGLKYYAGDRYKVTSSIKFTAYWVTKYTVSFDGDGDGAISPDPITVDNGEYITLPIATWSDHTFSCWKAGGLKYYAGDRYKVTSSIKFTAYWVKQYSQTFNGNADDVKTTKISINNGDYATIPNATRDKYNLLYWTTSSNGAGTKYYPGDSVKVSGENTFYAQWKRQTYNVLFDSNDGSEIKSVSVPMGSATTLPDVYRFGYNFIGWYSGSSYVGTSGDQYIPTESCTLIAGWESIGIGTYLIFGGIGILIILIIIIIVKVRKRNKSKHESNYMNNYLNDKPKRNIEDIINESEIKQDAEKKIADEKQEEIEAIKSESKMRLEAEKKANYEKQKEIDMLKKQEPKQIIYNIHGDLHSENIGILAKDDAIVNRTALSVDNKDDNFHDICDTGDISVRKCKNCGSEIRDKDDVFCRKCGNKLK